MLPHCPHSTIIPTNFLFVFLHCCQFSSSIRDWAWRILPARAGRELIAVLSHLPCRMAETIRGRSGLETTCTRRKMVPWLIIKGLTADEWTHCCSPSESFLSLSSSQLAANFHCDVHLLAAVRVRFISVRLPLQLQSWLHMESFLPLSRTGGSITPNCLM